LNVRFAVPRHALLVSSISVAKALLKSTFVRSTGQSLRPVSTSASFKLGLKYQYPTTFSKPLPFASGTDYLAIAIWRYPNSALAGSMILRGSTVLPREFDMARLA
jgi:hypothetical protein